MARPLFVTRWQQLCEFFVMLLIFYINCAILKKLWGYSSVGRAVASHVTGQGFESPYLHQNGALQMA